VRLAIAILGLASAASATTLEKLTLEQMAQQSTGVVRARVASCTANLHNRTVFTDCVLRVSETWKGPAVPERIVSVPGGTVGALRQSFAGAPALRGGDDYIFFLWTGRTGVTQVIGLSQGLLEIDLGAGLNRPMAVRAPVKEPMLDSDGRAIRDDGVDIPLAELRRLVEREGSR
jgi:hypothetical protein